MAPRSLPGDGSAPWSRAGSYDPGMRSAWTTSLVGSVALVLGFAVAQGTGVRWLGGIVLVAAAAWCARRWWSHSGPMRALVALLLFGIGFAVSHPLGSVIGAWPSVLVVSACCGLAAGLITGRSAVATQGAPARP